MHFQTLAALDLRPPKPNIYWSAGNLPICSDIGRRSPLCCAQWEAGFRCFEASHRVNRLKFRPKRLISLTAGRISVFVSSFSLAVTTQGFLFERVLLFICLLSSSLVTLTSSSSERCWCRSTSTWFRSWRLRRWRPINCAPSWRTRTRRSRGSNRRYQRASTHTHHFQYWTFKNWITHSVTHPLTQWRVKVDQTAARYKQPINVQIKTSHWQPHRTQHNAARSHSLFLSHSLTRTNHGWPLRPAANRS